MKKLILTLFLASASLVSFAQSTVKTIRMASPASSFTDNIPRGTQVVVLSTNAVYTAAAGFASGAYADVATAITANALVTVADTDTNVSTVVVEEELPSLVMYYEHIAHLMQDGDVIVAKCFVRTRMPAAVGVVPTSNIGSMAGTLLDSSEMDHLIERMKVECR